MRLEIARLELEIEQMRARRIKSSTSSTEGLSADLTEYLQQKRRTSALMRILGEFRDQVTRVWQIN